MTEQEQPEVVAVSWAEGEQIHGPEGDQIREPLRTLILTLHPETAPIVRRERPGPTPRCPQHIAADEDDGLEQG